MCNIRLVKAKMSDIDLLFKLDNDLEYRNNSFNSDLITYEEHLKWFSEVMSSETKIIYICMLDDDVIGMIRVELTSIKDEKLNMCSYTISTPYRGQGYGQIMVELLEKEILNTKFSKYPLFAQIKKRNIASCKIFENLGYKKEEKENYYEYRQDKYSTTLRKL